MNVRKNFLLRASKKTLYIMTIALLAVSAMGVFLLSSDSNIVSAQRDETRSSAKVARPDMFAIAFDFGAANDYAVLADKGVAESDSRVSGKVGVTSIDENGAAARNDLAKAFNAIEQLPCAERTSDLRMGKFSSGVYCASSAKLDGNITLDAAGNSNAFFVFRVDGKISADRGFNLTLVNGADMHKVFFVAGETADIAGGIDLSANIVARKGINVGAGSNVRGKALSLDGKVALTEAAVGGGTGVLQICKTVVGPGLGDRVFRFQIGGTTGPIYEVPAGSCSGQITLPAGVNTITELIDGRTTPTGTFTGRFRLIDVQSDPDGALVDVNLVTRTVQVNIRPGTTANQTVVEFINTFAVNAVVEICKRPVDDVTSGAGVLPAAYTPTAFPQPAATGGTSIQDRDVSGFFDFTIDALLDTVITVPVGQCSRPIQVNVPTPDIGAPPSDAVILITELGQPGDYRLEYASTFPGDRYNGISYNVGLDNSNIFGLPPFYNPGGGVVSVDVLEGGTNNSTVVTFFNRSEPGFIKICKIAGPGVPVGTVFQFEVRGREPSETPYANTDLNPPNANYTLGADPATFDDTFDFDAPTPGMILPGVDTTRLVEIPAGPAAQGGFCEFVRTGSPADTGARVTYITGSQVLVSEVGLGLTDPRAFPIVGPAPTSIGAVPGIPAGNPGGVNCVSPTSPTNPCPAVNTNPATGVRVSNIRLNAGTAAFVSPASIASTAPTTTDPRTGLTISATGTTTVTPNPNLAERRAIFRVRRGTTEIEFTNFLFRPVLLKVCKTAGAGVAPGASFTFNVTIQNTAVAGPTGPATGPFATGQLTVAPVTITAGPASPIAGQPGGNCVIVNGPFTTTATNPAFGTFSFGQVVTITETGIATNNQCTITAFSGTLGTPTGTGGCTVNLTLNAPAQFSNTIPINEVEFVNAVGGGPAPRGVEFDFDGDKKADMGAFRPSNGSWYVLRSRDGFMGMAFGAQNDKPVAADYDGDGKTDVAVFRAGTWYMQRSRDGFYGVQFGKGDGDDIPVAADYDGDGKADVAVFRQSTGSWYVLGSQSGFFGMAFGAQGDIPVAADYDGDGKADVAVFRAGTWYMMRSRDGFGATAFGTTGDKPVAADYDGDGKADIAVRRGSVWHLLRSRDGYAGIEFGLATDVPVPADYNGDGSTDVAVFRDGTWHIYDTQSSGASRSIQFGMGSDLAIPAR